MNIKEAPQSIQDVMAMLGKVEYGEQKMVEMIFSQSAHKLIAFEKKIKDLKAMFKMKSRHIVYQIHKDDWSELEEGLVKSLEIHFKFWENKFSDIQKFAKEAFEQLQHEQNTTDKDFHEYLEKVERLVPRDNKTVLNYKNVETMLVNLHELKDARYIRRQTNNISNKKLMENLRTRKKQFNHKALKIRKQHEKERESLYTTVLDSFEKLVRKRRKEFQKLWIKYIKITRTIENLQHKENYRLKDLEKKNLDSKKLGNPKYTKKTTLKDKNVLKRNVSLLADLGDLNVDYILRNNEKL